MDYVNEPYYLTREVEPWSLSQIYLPFTVFLFTHNLWFTLSLFFLTKFFENSIFMLFGSFFIFDIGEGDRLESRYDVTVRDPLSAMMGIFLAWYVGHLFQAARVLPVPWTVANFSLHPGYYIRNILGVATMVIFSVFLSFGFPTEKGQCGVPLGVVFYLAAGIAVIVVLFYINRTPDDMQWVWCHPPVAKRFTLRVRYNATYGLWLVAHCASSLCFMCTWSSGFVMALTSAIVLLGFSTFTWLLVDRSYRKGEGESFHIKNFFHCFAPQWGHLSTITSETLAIPGPASYSAVPSLRNEPPTFLLVDRLESGQQYKDAESGARGTNQPSNLFSSGVLLPPPANMVKQEPKGPQDPPPAGGAGL